MKTFLTVFALLVLVSCATGNRTRGTRDMASRKVPRAKVLRKMLEGSPDYIATKAGSEDPQSLCRGFRLRAKDIRHFFFHAAETAPPAEEVQQDAVFNCYVQGVIKNGKDRYRWQINHDGSGYLDLSKNTRVHLKCSHCPDRYTGH